MTMIADGEYRRLGYESSNDMIRHDARRGDGEYERAALHARQAGLGRQRMAGMAFAAGEYVQAASDWLSAAACFCLATNPARMRDCLAAAQQLEREGRVPAENRHVFAALREREGEARNLGETIRQFHADLDGRGGLVAPADAGTLDWLLGRVRDLAGYPWLHMAIYYQAQRLGGGDRADEHLSWALQFDPENPAFVAEGGRRFIAAGYPELATAAGHKFLADHPDGAAVVRVVMAEAIVVAAGGRGPDLEAALHLLLPVGDDPETRPRERLAALGLTAMLQQAVGTAEEFDRTLAAFNRAAAEADGPEARRMVAQLHNSLRRPAPNGVAAPHRVDVDGHEDDFAERFRDFSRLAA